MRSAHLDELGIETLENRQMMAGDVSVNVTGGGDLVIAGDNASNELEVRSTGFAGQYEIQGEAGTTINGQSSITVQGVVDDIRINLRGGDNRIKLQGTPSANNFNVDDVRFSSRNGEDSISLDMVNLSGQFRANMGGGIDAVGMRVVEASSINVRTGSGNDVVGMMDTDISGRADVNMGTGDDLLFSLRNEYQDARFRMGGGSDFVATALDTIQDLRLDGGGSTDELLTPTAPGDQTQVNGVNNTTNFEVTSEEPGLDFLEAVEDALESRIGNVHDDAF